MTVTTISKKVSKKDALRLIGEALILLADADDDTTTTVDTSTPMPADAIIARRDGTSAGWLRSHVTEAGRGARRTPLYRLADVDAALAGAAHPPKPPKKREITGVNEDPIDAMVRRGELRAVRGGR